MSRWVFTDPATLGTWTVPWNPDTMSSPYRKVGVDSLPASPADARLRLKVSEQPVEWTFEGPMMGWDHYNTLLEWVRKPNPIIIDDHLGRTIVVLLTQLELSDKRSRRTHAKWRYIVHGHIVGVIEDGS